MVCLQMQGKKRVNVLLTGAHAFYKDIVFYAFVCQTEEARLAFTLNDASTFLSERIPEPGIRKRRNTSIPAEIHKVLGIIVLPETPSLKLSPSPSPSLTERKAIETENTRHKTHHAL